MKSGAKKNSEPEFKVGDYVVYPMHGVGAVTEVSKKTILGKKRDCYSLEIQTTKMKVPKSIVTEIEICHQGTPNGILINITMGEVKGIIEKTVATVP